MLSGRHMLPTIPASDLARTRAWYADKLGFAAGEEEAAALLYRSGEDRLFLLFSSPGAGTAQHQLAAWVVEDLAAEVAELRARGVEFEEYDEPGLRTVDGIVVTPVGTAAWFKDSEATRSPSFSLVAALRRLKVQGLIYRAVAVAEMRVTGWPGWSRRVGPAVHDQQRRRRYEVRAGRPNRR